MATGPACQPAFSASEARLHNRDSPGSALCALNGSAAHCLTANPRQITLVCVAHIQPVPLYYIFPLPGQSVGAPRTYTLLSCSVGFGGVCRFMRSAMIRSSSPHPAPLHGNALGGINGGNGGTQRGDFRGRFARVIGLPAVHRMWRNPAPRTGAFRSSGRAGQHPSDPVT